MMLAAVSFFTSTEPIDALGLRKEVDELFD